jgi:predicted DNA-binding protein
MSRQAEMKRRRRAAGWKCVEVWIDPKTVERLDAVRGETSRTSYVERALETGIESDETLAVLLVEEGRASHVNE